MNDHGFEPNDPGWKDRVRAGFARQGALRLLGATLADLAPGRCVIALPFRDDLAQHNGYFHAGVTSTIADAAGGFAALSLFGPDNEVLSVEFKINLIAPAHGERLLAEGRVVRSGRTLTVSAIDVFVETGAARSACALMQQTLIRVASAPEPASR